MAVRVFVERPGSMGTGALVGARVCPWRHDLHAPRASRRHAGRHRFSHAMVFPRGAQKRLIAVMIFPGKHGGGWPSWDGGLWRVLSSNSSSDM